MTTTLPAVNEIRPELIAFARLMELKLRKHDGEWGTGWKTWDPREALKRLLEEAAEVGREINPPPCGCRSAAHELCGGHPFWEPDPARVGFEAADVGNFAMFIADMCGALDGLVEVAGVKPTVIIPRQVRRREDMSPSGCMSLFLQEDGDVVIEISGREEGGEHQRAVAEFCAGGGGGLSPRTVEALKLLMAAMQADNDAGPRSRDYERQHLFNLREEDRDWSR